MIFMSCKFVSCDTSTNKSALALFVDGKIESHILIDESKNRDVDVRIDAMVSKIYGTLDAWNPDILWIEHPQGHGSNVSMVGKLCEILGAVRGWCVLHGCEYHEIAPSQWRHYCGISQGKKTRSELKQASIDYIKDKLGIDEGDDVADSIALGYGVLNYFSGLGAD